MHIETTRDTPPTFIKRTPFTFAAQEIVEAYGIPRYLEYNPGVFTTITYPFTFAIMFGDTGHGFLLLVFALYLLFMERYWEGKKLNEFLSMAYQSSAARPPARPPACPPASECSLLSLAASWAAMPHGKCLCAPPRTRTHGTCRAVCKRHVSYSLLGTGAAAALLGIAHAVARALGGMPKTFTWVHAAARYLLLLMSVFSIYMGLIYNDTFGTAQPLFGSAWICKELPPHVGNGTAPTPSCPGLNSKSTCCPVDASGARAVYPFGIDPVWALSANKLTFYNSFKMKMSVIFGVIQMTAGTCCKLTNALYFAKPRDIWFEVIPEFVFMQCTFGYLVVIIFYKWNTDWIAMGVEAPPLLDTLIQMFMGLGAVPKDPRGNDMPLYSGQAVVQRVLLALTFISVPLLLIPKPCLIYHDHKKQYKEVKKDEEPGHADEHDDHEHEEHDFSEVVVHQVIHTIEYVLGAVSNTASYLSDSSPGPAVFSPFRRHAPLPCAHCLILP